MPLKKLSHLIAASPSTLAVRRLARSTIRKGKQLKKGLPARGDYARQAKWQHHVSKIGSGANVKPK